MRHSIIGMARTSALLLTCSCLAFALELRAYSEGVFMIVHGDTLVPASDLAKSIAIFKSNNPSEIVLAFSSNYPVEGDENVRWSKLWYRRELTKLAHGPDGWDLRSIRIIEAPKR